jgi:hypothetical protein
MHGTGSQILRRRRRLIFRGKTAGGRTQKTPLNYRFEDASPRVCRETRAKQPPNRCP